MHSKRPLLGNTHEAHTLTAVTGAVVVRNEVRVGEVQEARFVATTARGRPVAAAGADIVNRCPVTVARSRQENCPGILKRGPL